MQDHTRWGVFGISYRTIPCDEVVRQLVIEWPEPLSIAMTSPFVSSIVQPAAWQACCECDCPIRILQLDEINAVGIAYMDATSAEAVLCATAAE